MPTQFDLCEETGMLAESGTCPVHGGDACLRVFVPCGDPREIASLRGTMTQIAVGAKLGATAESLSAIAEAALLDN